MESLSSTQAMEDPVAFIRSHCAEEMTTLDKVIDTHLLNNVPLLEAVMKHLILGGGKRLRPLLTLACYKALAETFPTTPHKDTKIIDLGVAIEFIHNATLLHDDVVDESALRHGKPSANEVFGSKASILVGDFLFAKAFELMLGTDEERVLPILAKVSQTITQGEVFQLGYIRTFDLSYDVMFHIIGTKTAALFAASTEVGAALLALPTAVQQQMHEYGRNLGITFQIVDDILDYFGNAQTLGKDIGDDLREGKVTLPLYLAYHNGTASEKQFLEKVINLAEVTEQNLTDVLTILHRTQAGEKCLKIAEEFALKASDSLKILEKSPLVMALLHLPKKLLSRVQ